MPSIKISALTEKATMAGTEEVLINDSGTSKKFSTQRFLDIKTASETARDAALAAQTASETAETNAETAETSASGSATAAATSETNAATSETNAASSATTAGTHATNAGTSETNAATSATNASDSETNASTSETNAASSATSASGSATTATTQAGNASTSATNAATSESNANGSATAAANSATAASGSATSASNSASSATTAQTAAEAARDAALASFDSFDDRYLGQKASDPTTDNDGNALVGGTLYFNSTTDSMMVYEGSTWVAAYASLSGALLQTNNLSDLSNAGVARTNLGVDIAGTVNYTHPTTHSTSDIADDAITAAKLAVTGNGTAGQYLGSDADGTFTWTSISADPTMGGDLTGTASNAQLGANVVTDTELNSAKVNGIESGADVTDTANVVAALTAGTNITISAGGTISSTDTNTTYSVGDGGLTEKNFTSADNTKLDGIETGATADQSNSEIKTAYEANANTNAFTDADHSKLDGIEASADVTDTTNVTAAGALMDSEITNLAQVKAFDSTDYATAAHNHSGVYEPADATILKDADIGTTVLAPNGDGSALTGVQPFPSGTKMVFAQASAPTGWTQDTTNNDKALRVVSGSGGGTGGTHGLSSPPSTSHSHTGGAHTHNTPNHAHSHNLSAGSHTLSTSQMPSHNHGLRRNNGGGNGYNTIANPNIVWGASRFSFISQTQYISNTGSSGSHSHSMSGSISSSGASTTGSAGANTTSSASTTAFAPQYIDVIVCSKN